MTPVFSGETMLAGWSESHNGGAKVTFWLSDPSDLDAFRGMTVAKGRVAGQRLAMVLVEIGDDEQPKASTDAAIVQAAHEETRAKGGELARLSGILCGDAGFQDWLKAMNRGLWEGTMNAVGDNATPATVAATIIRGRCGVESRAELDHNPKAAEIFHAQFRRPFHEFQGGR